MPLLTRPFSPYPPTLPPTPSLRQVPARLRRPHALLQALRQPRRRQRPPRARPGGRGGPLCGGWRGGVIAGPPPTFTTATPPQQTNGADCGVHVIVNAGAVAGVGGEGGWAAADAAVAAAAGAVGRERARLRAEILGGEG